MVSSFRRSSHIQPLQAAWFRRVPVSLVCSRRACAEEWRRRHWCSPQRRPDYILPDQCGSRRPSNSKIRQRHVALLEREGYIRSETVGKKGKRYWVANPIRWSLLSAKIDHHKNGGSSDVDTTNVADHPENDTTKMWGASPQKCGDDTHKNVVSNKEQEPRTNKNLKPRGGGTQTDRSRGENHCPNGCLWNHGLAFWKCASA